MAHQPFGGRVTVSGTPQALHTLLGVPDTTFGPLVARAEATSRGQAATVFIGVDATVTSAGVNAVGYIEPSDWISLDQIGNTHLATLYLVGSAGDKVYILGITY